MIDLLRVRVDFIEMARPSVAYCRRLGLDWSAIKAACGGVFLAPIAVDRTWFDFDPEGFEAAAKIPPTRCATPRRPSWP